MVPLHRDWRQNRPAIRTGTISLEGHVPGNEVASVLFLLLKSACAISLIVRGVIELPAGLAPGLETVPAAAMKLFVRLGLAALAALLHSGPTVRGKGAMSSGF